MSFVVKVACGNLV
ncbi:hypothetical protein M2H09_23050 [Vibrio vulnificus]|nr:hypothetical protein [Vibrio vulnificus]